MKPIFTFLAYLWLTITYSQDAFITTWKTDNPGVSLDNQITINTRINYNNYNYFVDWGDGTSSENVTSEITHTYDTPGIYQVSITGIFPAIKFGIINGEPRDELKLLEVNQWGNQQWQILGGAFDGCENLDVTATDIPDLSNVWDVSFMFRGCDSLIFNSSINDWDVSNVTFMASMFNDAPNFNQNISNWNVASVTNMSGMFVFSGFNQDIGMWETGSVESMNQMFFDSPFNQNISDWDVSNVTDMSGMFRQTPFNQDIGNWNVGKVEDLSGMFESSLFDQNLGNWNIGKVLIMNSIFSNSSLSQENYDNTLIGWARLPSLQNNVQFDAGSSTYCVGESAKLELINTYNWTILDSGKSNCPFITTWKTDNPGLSEDNQITIPTFTNQIYDYTVDWGDGIIETNITGDAIHTYASVGTYQVSISGAFPRIYFNTGNIPIGDENKIIEVNQWGDIEWKSMQNSFSGCKNLDVSATDVPNLQSVENMRGMFSDCSSLIGTENFNQWDVANIKRMDYMFSSASLFNQEIGNWDLSNATNLEAMFLRAYAFNQNIGEWNVTNVENIRAMFYEAKVFNQDISKWNLPNVTSFEILFRSASSFNQDIGNWDVSRITNMNSMFFGASAFNQDIGNWDVSDVTQMQEMFKEATSFNQDLSNWDVAKVTDMTAMFLRASLFNGNLSLWNVSNVLNLSYMFHEASNFDQNLGSWNISNVLDMSSMFFNSGLSNENYDKTIINWSNLANLKSNLIFDAGTSQFCSSEQARQFIIDTYGWTINDGGKVPFCNEDNDLDGILDHKDDCLETRPNVSINEYGCETIAPDAILVYGATPTCPGEANGSIAISSSLLDYSFNISINGPVPSEYVNSPLNEPLEISNLPVGVYIITISIPDISYTQSYGIQINEVGSISGKRQDLDTKAKSVSYNLEGSYSYKVNLNGAIKTYNFESDGINEIYLTDLGEFNSISISGESDCQGVITDSFNISDSIIIYPIKTKSKAFIEGYETQSRVQVYDITGRLLFQKKLIKNELESLNFESYDNGIYPVKIISKNNTQTFKIIKQ
jgi:surface protein